MGAFSRRQGMRQEYSGPGEVSSELRERLKLITERYLADERHLGIGNEGLWVYEREFHHRLSMHFGRPVKANAVIVGGEWHEVLDLTEFFLAVANSTASARYSEILSETMQAFVLSGSVYYVNREGQIALRVEPETAKRIDQATRVLRPIDRAKKVFEGAAAGLTTRRMKPEDVVKDTYVALEEYLKTKTGEKDLSDAVKALRKKGVLTPTQAKIIELLYGFRSGSFGVSHAGETRAPTESDALWFLDTVSAQILFLGRVIK